jgi:cell division septation protein DedD
LSDSQEPSYYEIALTNRQVLVAFVILLCCVLAAFFAGVWVGKGSPAAAATEAQQAAPQPTPSAEAPQEMAFFNDQDKGAAERPDLQQMAKKPRPGTTLAQDLGVQDGSPSPSPDGGDDEAPAPAATVAAPHAAASPAGGGAHEPTGDDLAAKPAAPGSLFIQVFSSKEEGQARRLAHRLRSAGLPAFLSPAGGKFRVRIGPYTDRAAAEASAAKARREFHVDTWITSNP